MLLKRLKDRLFKNSSVLKDNDFLKLFTSFTESGPKDDRTNEVIRWANDQGYLDDLGLSEGSAEVLLRNLLEEKDSPQELLKNEKIRKELLSVIAKEAAEKRGLTSTEAEQATKLVLSGEVFRDVGYTISLIFSLVAKPERFSNPDENLKSFVRGLFALPRAIVSDTNPQKLAERIALQFELFREGKPPESPNILDNTLKEIYALPELGDIVDTASALLDQENESLRLLLLIYARLNGINLEQQDIDKVQVTLLNRENPDLGALLLYLAQDDTLSRLR